MSQRRDKVLFNSEKEQYRRWRITQVNTNKKIFIESLFINYVSNNNDTITSDEAGSV